MHTIEPQDAVCEAHCLVMMAECLASSILSALEAQVQGLGVRLTFATRKSLQVSKLEVAAGMESADKGWASC